MGSFSIPVPNLTFSKILAPPVFSGGRRKGLILTVFVKICLGARETTKIAYFGVKTLKNRACGAIFEPGARAKSRLRRDFAGARA